jgi:cytoskeletal protein CcmA (bactofilin family)
MLLWNRSSKLPARTKGLTAFLDEGSEIEGRYTFSGVVLLNGKFKGEIISTDTLIIGEKAVVNATIRAGAVVISGELVASWPPSGWRCERARGSSRMWRRRSW